MTDKKELSKKAARQIALAANVCAEAKGSKREQAQERLFNLMEKFTGTLGIERILHIISENGGGKE